MYEQRLENIERLTHQSKWHRLMNYPIRLGWAFMHRTLVYPFSKKGTVRSTKTFFEIPMSVELPAGTDLYVFGAKTHPSEIQLTKFLMANIKAGDVFFDVGAHVGFYSLLAMHLGAKVTSFEPTQQTFQLLEQNTKSHAAIKIWNKAVSHVDGEVTFYEYDTQLSENNTTNLQDEHAEHVKAVIVPAVTLDNYIKTHNTIPKLIKIDVEGGELQVIKGMSELIEHSPTLIIEYIPNEKEKYLTAFEILRHKDFKQYLIDNQGNLYACKDLNTIESLDSTNVVFVKS